jgi:Arc/MetJ-type ribon-helix-helix transcriptional regulator
LVRLDDRVYVWHIGGMSRKVTYQIDERLDADVRQAVHDGAAETMSAFVEEALRAHLRELRRERIRDGIREAARDELFRQDVAETTRAYGPGSAEGLE